MKGGGGPPRRFESGKVMIAVPAKVEAALIRPCLTALGTQVAISADAIVLVVNNTVDAIASVVCDLAGQLSAPVDIIEHYFPPEQACAGAARRIAIKRRQRLPAQTASF